MANRIVSEKEFRVEFRKEVILVCDFSQKKAKHCLGIGARQMSITTGVEIVSALKAKFESDGRTLDKVLADLHTPRGLRRYASSQLNQMAKVALARGANAIETLWKTFGDLIVVARKGRENIYVAKNGATAMELSSLVELRSGKTSAKIKFDETIANAVDQGRDALNGRSLGEAYAETCTEYFKALPAAE